jgi:hypothetical protein
LAAAQPGANEVQLPAQIASQPVHGFQREGQPQFFRRRLERKSRQQPDQQLPEQRGGKGVTRQNLGQTKGKRASATAALPAIGTEYPLAPEPLAGGCRQIIAAQDAVPVQRVGSAAVRARPLLERKSCDFSSPSSHTKQKCELDIRPCCLNPIRFVEHFLTALLAAQLI